VKWLTGAACLLVAAADCILSGQATAGQLSFQPSVNVTVDDDSNRDLAAEGVGSQSESLQATADFKGSTESTAFTISPLVRYQNFDSRAYADIFERDLSLTDVWTLERGQLSLNGEYGDHSTLTTEATETGLLSSRLHQRLDQGGLSYTYNQSERLALIGSGSYTDVSYYGTPDSYLLNLLSGYRYPSGSLGEQFLVSETSTLTANISYSEVLARLPGANSRDTSGTLEYHRSFSVAIDLDAVIGASRAQSATSQTLPNGTLSLTRRYALGSVALSYNRGLSPYGTGDLVERQTIALSGSRALSDQLDITVSVSRVQNSQLNIQPQFGQLPQVQTYNNAQVSCGWQFAQFWNLNGLFGTTRTQTPSPSSQTVQEWRVALSLTWSPQPRTAFF
jgi:hypothetical protein